MKIRVGMVSLGCPKNQVDAEIMLADLKNNDFEIVNDAALADAVIVNTCGFIEDSKKESIENILEFCELKKEGRIKCIAVTGCLAERYKDEVAKEIPEADVILGLGNNHQIADAIKKAINNNSVVYEFGDKYNLPLTGERVLSTLSSTAYLKIAEGCDNNCTYCAIPMIRGGFRSRELEHIVSEANTLADQGVEEIILIAQDTSRYGEDLTDSGESLLPELLEELVKIDKIRWIRILYCYPERITDKLIDTIAKHDKILKYIDLPLQHANKRILKLMNRHGDRETLTKLIEKIRNRIPGVVLRTSLIAGFPSETEEEFAELCEFVQDIKFERLGCFAYSQEDDTPAAKLPDQIDQEIKVKRAEHIMDLQYDINYQYANNMIGEVIDVLVEGFDRYGDCYFGRSKADSPEIDFKVFIDKNQKLNPGDFVKVKIYDTLDLDLIAELV